MIKDFLDSIKSISNFWKYCAFISVVFLGLAITFLKTQKFNEIWAFFFKEKLSKKHSFLIIKRIVTLIFFLVALIFTLLLVVPLFYKPDHTDVLPYEKQKALYMEAMGNFNSQNNSKAIEKFKLLFDVNPNFPESAYYYGKSLFFQYRYEEAISILMQVPKIEDHIDLDYMIGKSFVDQDNYIQAYHYLKNAVDKFYSEKDGRYWVSQLLLLFCARKNEKTSVNEYSNKLKELLHDIDFELENSLKHSSNHPKNKDIKITMKPTNKELDWIFTQRAVAFSLLIELGEQYYLMQNNIEALNSIILGFSYLKYPINCTPSGISVNSERLIKAMSFATLVLAEMKFTNTFEFPQKMNEFRCLLDNLETGKEEFGRINIDQKEDNMLNALRMTLGYSLTPSKNYPDIVEMINLVQTVFGFSEKPIEIKENKYKIKYRTCLSPNDSIGKLIISSTQYSLEKTVFIISKKDFIIDENISIDRGFLMKEKPTVRITNYFKNGKKCCYVDVYPPWIIYGDFSPSIYSHLGCSI